MLSKKSLAAIWHVSQRPHLVCIPAEEVEISVFPRVGWKSLAFEEVVPVFTREIRRKLAAVGLCDCLSKVLP